MTSILFVIVRIYRNYFKFIYVRKKPFCALFAQFLKSMLNFEQCEKMITLKAYLFPKLRATKGVVT